MIESLTDSQKTRFAEFIGKWTRIGLSTEPADKPKAEEGIKLIYGAAGLKPPTIVWCSSPLASGLTRAIIRGKGKVWASVRASVGDSVWASVWDSVWASVWDSVWDSVRDSVWASVWASVRDSVWASVRASVWASVGASVWDSGYGQHDANWLGFYDYFCSVCGLTQETEKLKGHWMQSQSAGWYLPHKKMCWVSERHNLLRLNKRGRLHCETGPAVAYPDGWSIFALNGIRMKQEYVTTPADRLKPETILAESNVDIRRELVRKVGVLRLVSHGKTVGEMGEYKLVDMHKIFPHREYAPFLLMRNPSVDDTWHLEGVSPDCRTVQEAINWRAGNREIEWSPALLS